jgi:hypothetical protein
MELTFVGPVIEWRGPAPYYFVPVPDEESADIREVAAVRKPQGLAPGDEVVVEMAVRL